MMRVEDGGVCAASSHLCGHQLMQQTLLYATKCIFVYLPYVQYALYNLYILLQKPWCAYCTLKCHQLLPQTLLAPYMHNVAGKKCTILLASSCTIYCWSSYMHTITGLHLQNIAGPHKCTIFLQPIRTICTVHSVLLKPQCTSPV